MTEALTRFSDALAETVQDASQSVVRVEARQRFPATGIVWHTDGVIVTAHHVVQRDEEIRVGLSDDQTVPATLVGRDPTTDLAVLRAEATGLEAASWKETDDLQVGHLILALGRPGQSVLATLGIVSALGKAWRTSAGGQIDRTLQTDVTMYPGFSGGPLVDAAGGVRGLNSSLLARGVTMTVPTETVQRVAETLLAHGQVRRGYLGVGAQAVQLPEPIKEALDQEVGLLLMSVEAEEPAAQGGLLLGDTIVSLDDQPVRQIDDLLALLSGDRIGKITSVRIVRGGQLQTVDVVIGEHP